MDLAKFGPDYLERYVDAVLDGGTARPGPGKLHGYAAKLIREIVADAAIGKGLRL